MNQGLTPAPASEQLSATAARPVTPAPTATTPATLNAKAATRPTLRVRYWEHMDPASQSLYPVD